MPQELKDPLLIATANITLLVSAVLCLVLVIARARGPLLEFRPRRPVPWNGIGALLAPFFVLLGIVAAIFPADAPTSPLTNEKAVESSERRQQSHDQEINPQNHNNTFKQLLGALQETVLVGGIVIMISLYFKASPSDLGVTSDLPTLARNILIGFVVGIASLAPVRLMQGWLMYLAGKQELDSDHPLVRALREHPPGVMAMLAASLMAVVIAPICEEITFRLLLQGWLEKWQYFKTKCAHVNSLADEPMHEPVQSVSEMHIQTVDSNPIDVQDDLTLPIIDIPPRHGLAGLPFGLIPIMTSSLLFGLAHFGYGPDPIPLFLLAVMLGYVYYRTHSIVPSIIAHALFNSFTMLVLWRLWFIGGK